MDLPPAGFDELVDELRELGVDERLVPALAASADDILRALPELLKRAARAAAPAGSAALDDEEITRRVAAHGCSTSRPPTSASSRRRSGAWDGRSTARADARLQPDRMGRISVPTRCGATWPTRGCRSSRCCAGAASSARDSWCSAT